MSRRRILVVDDDDDIRGLVRELLERRGFTVAEAVDGRQALHEFYEGRPDLVVLDVGMPGFDGWTTLERIRELSDVPVVMLTARAAELEKTRGLQAGADDYVTKPFGRQELLARIEALLRRAGGREAEPPETYSDAFVSIDFAQRAVNAGGRAVELTPLEFKLLSAFVRHPNQVLSHEQLLQLVWGGAGASREQVKLYVGYLRRKLCPNDPENAPIETKRGFGYSYRPKRSA
jgi:DNA-binding response OmpR family regulator